MNLVFQKPPGCPQKRNIEQNCAGRPPVPFVVRRSCPHGFPLPTEVSEAPPTTATRTKEPVGLRVLLMWKWARPHHGEPSPPSPHLRRFPTPQLVLCEATAHAIHWGGGSYRESAKTPSCPPAQCCPGPGDSAEPPPAAADPAVAPGLATCTLGRAVPQDGRAERQPWAEAWDRVASPPPYLEGLKGLCTPR